MNDIKWRHRDSNDFHYALWRYHNHTILVETDITFRIMKNRYGMDGLTFAVKADTSTGHFEVSTHIEDDEETSTSTQTNGFGGVDSIDKALMKQRFFELQTD